MYCSQKLPVLGITVSFCRAGHTLLRPALSSNDALYVLGSHDSARVGSSRRSRPDTHTPCSSDPNLHSTLLSASWAGFLAQSTMEGYDASDGLSVEFPRYSNLVSAVHRSLSVNKRNYFQDNDTTVLLKNAFPQHLDSIGEPECSGFSVACGSGEFHQVRPHLERGGWILDNNAQLSLHDPNSGFKWAMDNRPGWETAISSALSTRDDCLGAQPLAMPNLDIVKLQSGILPLDNSHLTTAIDFHHRTSIPGWNLQELPGGDSSTKEVSSFAMSRQVHQEANTDLEPYAFQTFEAYERESVTPTQQIARSDEHESQEIPTIEHHTCPVCKRFSSDVRNLREYMRCHERQHKCPHDSCSRSFSTQRDLRRHRKAVHQKIAIACPICSASIRGGRRDNLKRHMRACHPFES